jgi:heme o synthase
LALPYVLGVAGLIYAAGAGVLTLVFMLHAAAVFRQRQGEAAIRACKKLFGFSILWLFLIFALIPLDRLIQHLLGQG